MRLLLTGGCGFMGHHFVEFLLKNTDHEIVIIDKLTYASLGLSRLYDIECYPAMQGRVKLFTHDFATPFPDEMVKEIGPIDYIVHMGAETHVDNSITDPYPFVISNVVGTFQMLEFARIHKETLKKFIYFSTDEVFGPADIEEKPLGFKEWDRYKSSNPYAATKAGGEELCIAYENTYKLPIVITHTMNLFGERQHFEKYVPKVINYIIEGKELQVHSDPTCTTPGSRFWIHCRNASKAIDFLLVEGVPGDKYNVVGDKEINNLDMALFISSVLDKPLKYKLVNFHESRPGHDTRYALDGSKLKNMGFSYPVSFTDSLIKTIKWTIDNSEWLC